MKVSRKQEARARHAFAVLFARHDPSAVRLAIKIDNPNIRSRRGVDDPNIRTARARARDRIGGGCGGDCACKKCQDKVGKKYNGKKGRDRIGAELGSTRALSYMDQVNRDAEGLASDVAVQTRPGAAPNSVGQAFLGPWNDFLNAAPNADENADEFPVGWRNWYQGNSSLASRVARTEAIFRRTGEYERRLIELWTQFQSLGGRPTKPIPAPGYEPKKDDKGETFEGVFGRAGEFIEKAVIGVVVVGGLYLLAAHAVTR